MDSVEELVAFATATLLIGAGAIEGVAMEAAYFINPSLLKQSALYAYHTYSTEVM